MDRTSLERLEHELDVERAYLGSLRYGMLAGAGGLLIRHLAVERGAGGGWPGFLLVLVGIGLALTGTVRYERWRRSQVGGLVTPLPRIATWGVAMLMVVGLVIALLPE